MSSTSNNAAVTGNDAVDDVMATSQSAENGTSHDTADGDIKNDVLSSFISIGRIMAYRAIHRRLVFPRRQIARAANMLSTHAVAKAASWPRSGTSDQTSQKDLAAMFGMSRQAYGRNLLKKTGGQRSHQPAVHPGRGQPRHDVSLTNQGRKAADLLGKAPDQTSSMLDCLNETELQTLHGYLQRIIDTSSDDPTGPRPPRMSKSGEAAYRTPQAQAKCRPTRAIVCEQPARLGGA